MSLILEEDQKKLRELFAAQLADDVQITLFTQAESESGMPVQECQYCKETRITMEDFSALSGKIKLQVYDFVADADKVKEYQVDKIPAIIVDRDGNDNIRYFGIPNGYEFATLVGTVVNVSKGETDLKPDTKKALKKIDRDLHIQVFVTPT